MAPPGGGNGRPAGGIGGPPLGPGGKGGMGGMPRPPGAAVRGLDCSLRLETGRDLRGIGGKPPGGAPGIPGNGGGTPEDVLAYLVVRIGVMGRARYLREANVPPGKGNGGGKPAAGWFWGSMGFA
jgi:hypothetical protein